MSFLPARRALRRSFTLAVLIATITAPLSQAADPPRAADTRFTLGEVVVTAQRRARAGADLPGSVDVLGADLSQRLIVDQAWEILGRLPGVLLTDFNQGTTSGKFSMRGFNGEGEVNAVKLLIDGIPSNTNDGNMPFIDAVFPLDLQSVEVVRGTADPRWGLHAIAGSTDLRTRIGGTYLDGRISTGSFGSNDVQVSAGIERGGFSQNYLLAWRDSEGYRDHADADRKAAAGKWFLDVSDALRVGAIVRHYESEADEPGYLSRAQASQEPQASNAFSASDGGDRTMGQYSLHLDATLGAHTDLFVRAYANRYEDLRFVRFSENVSQQERYSDEEQKGLIAALRVSPEVTTLHALAFEVGGDMQWQNNVSERYLTQERTRSRQTRGQEFDLEVGGLYAQAVVEPTQWLKITPAYRVERVDGAFSNTLTGLDNDVNDYGNIGQPKLSVALTPLDGLTAYANAGKSFQIGLGSGAYKIPPRVDDLEPSINEGWEIGLRYAGNAGAEARIAWWEQEASGEVKRKLNDPLGDFDNVGRTRREGLDLQFGFHPEEHVALWMSYAWQRARILKPDPATPQYAGNRIDHVPVHLLSGGIDVELSPVLRFSAWANAQSNYELDASNSHGSFGAQRLLNAELAWQAAPRLELSLQVKNLGNDHYEYVWWDGVQSLHSPGDERAAYASARFRL